MIFDTPTVGVVMRTARLRAAMSMADLSEATGVAVQRLEAYEDGASMPLDTLAQIVAATGARMVVGVADARAADWGASDHDDLEASVTTLLLETAPPASYPLSLRRTWLYVPVGLLILARAQLQGAVALNALGHLRSVGPVLARTVFEHVATALWLAEDPTERSKQFMQHSNLQLERLAAQADGWDGKLADAQRRWTDAFTDEPFTGRLPPFEQRLIEPIRAWYPRYRDLSSRTHPTALAVDAMLEVTPHEVAVRVDGPDAQMLAFAAVLVWTLALQVETGFAQFHTERTGLAFDCDMDEFVTLGVELNRHLTA